MKKLLLSLILFFVFAQNTTAQNSLSLNNSQLLSLDEIFRIYPYHNESIDFNMYPPIYKRIVESAFVKKILRKTMSYKLTDQVISQIKYDKPDWTNNERQKYEYNSENQLIRITTQKWNGTNWVDWMKTEYNRTESGAIGGYAGYTLTNGSWAQSHSTTYIFDGQGNNTGYEYETFGSFPTRMKTLNTTDANGRTVLSESYTWNSSTGQYTKTGEYNYTYNAQGKQIESIYKTNSNGTLVNSNRSVTERNGDGTTKKTTSYSWNSTSGSWTQGSTTEYSYYSNSTNQAEVVTKNNSGVPTQRLLYTYSATNKILTNETQTWDNSMQSWNPWWRTDRTYTSDDYTASSTRNSYTPGKGYEEYDRELYEYITVETSTKVRLTTSVFPPAAEQDGSTVTPSGTTEYNKNTKVTLDAKAGDGWVFERWTGNLTGTTKPQELTMDDDKNVVANFQPLLTLSLSSPNENNLCPPALNEELLIATAGIFVDGVDWLLTGISFTAAEKYKPSFTEAWIEYAGNKLKGKINVDADSNATSYTFSPTQQINEGTTLSVKLILKFMYPSKSAEKYIPAALTEVKKYKVSIQVGQVTCIPIPEDARPGVKGPIETFYSNKQIMASVWNVSKEPDLPFATINEAVNSTQTVDGNIIELCPNIFTENIIVNKKLTIQGKTDYKSTIVKALKNIDHVFTVERDEVTLKKISIVGANGTGAAGVYIDKENFHYRIVNIYDCYIGDNYNGINSNSVVNIYYSFVKKNKHDGIQCDSLSAILILVDQNGGNGVYSYGGINFESLEGYTASASYNTQNGLYAKGRIISNKYGGIFRFNSNKSSGVYCDGNLFEIRSNSVIADSNKEYGIYSKSNLKSSHVFARFNGKDGLKSNYVSCTQTVTDNNEGDGINANFINLAGIRGEEISSSYNKLNGYNADQLTIDADTGAVKINRNGMNGVLAQSNAEIYRPSSATIDSNAHYGIYPPQNLRIRNASVRYNGKGGLFGSYIVSSNIIADHNKGIGINGDLIFLGAWDGNLSSASYNSEDGVRAGELVAYAEDGGKLRFNKNGESGITAIPFHMEIYSQSSQENNLTIDSNVVHGAYAKGDIKISNGFIRNNGKDGLHAGYIYVTNVKSDFNKGSGIVGTQLLALRSIDGFRSTSNDNGEYGIRTREGVISAANILRNKKDGIYAEIVEFNQGAVNNNFGWGMHIYGYPTNSKIKFVNLTGNSLGAINYTYNNPSQIGMNKIALADISILENCEISKNNGPGVLYNANVSASILSCNIYGNREYGLNNLSNSATIKAFGNYWGSSSGPSGSGSGIGDKVSPNVLYSNWLSNPLSVIISLSIDTLNSVKSSIDTFDVGFYNYLKIPDKLNVTVTDSLGWLTSPKNFSIDLLDSNYFSKPVVLTIPTNAINEKNIIRINAVSNSNNNQQYQKTISQFVYSQQAVEINVTHANSVVAQNKEIKFTANVIDQFGKSITTSPIWSTSKGTINSQGLYTAPSDTGRYTVTAKSGNVQASVFILVVPKEPVLQRIHVYPDSVYLNPNQEYQFLATGLNQFDSLHIFIPYWSANGGTIDQKGKYVAGSTKGIYKVIAYSGSIKDEAIVNVGVVVSTKEVVIPTEYCLYQNYPNPFNPETKIKYDLPKTSRVVLKVYDILGREVTTLVNKEQSAGRYEVMFSSKANNIASGVYIYRITVGNYSLVRKMLLLK